MNAFAKRYFVWISLIFLAFLSFFFLNSFLKISFIFLLILGIFVLFLLRKRIRGANTRIVLVLVILAAVLGLVRGGILLIQNGRFVQKYEGEHTVVGYVSSVEADRSFCGELIVRIESIDGESVAADVLMVAEGDAELWRGDFFRCTVRALPLGQYQNSVYLKNKDPNKYPLVFVLKSDAEVELLESEFRPRLVLSGLNSRLSSMLKAKLGTRAGGLASALLLGNRELLADETLRDFRRAGVYHMLALSGMHVAILIGILEYILKNLYVPKGVRVVILAVLSGFYIALTGFIPSACRSMLMLWMLYASYLVGGSRDPMTSLFFAVSLIALVDPVAIADLGLQLSFLSTFGVICSSIIMKSSKLFKNREKSEHISKKILRAIISSLVATLCVSVATLPALAVFFGEFSLATFVTNIVIGLICEIFMVLSLVTLVLPYSGVLTVPVVKVSVAVCDMMLGMVGAISDLEFTVVSLAYPGVTVLSFILLIACVILLAVRIERRWLLGVPCAAFALVFAVIAAITAVQSMERVKSEFIVGDSLILTSGQGAYIVDASDGGYGTLYEAARRTKAAYHTEIEAVVLTHYHRQHTVSLERLSKQTKLRRVLLPMPKDSAEGSIMSSIVRVLESEGVEVYIYRADEPIDVLGGKLSVSARAFIRGTSQPAFLVSYAKDSDRITLIEGRYFDSYFGELAPDPRLREADYVIFGSEGSAAKESFKLFEHLERAKEVSFCDFETMEKSDFEAYMEQVDIYFDTEYKKYILK